MYRVAIIYCGKGRIVFPLTVARGKELFVFEGFAGNGGRPRSCGTARNARTAWGKSENVAVFFFASLHPVLFRPNFRDILEKKD